MTTPLPFTPSQRTCEDVNLKPATGGLGNASSDVPDPPCLAGGRWKGAVGREPPPLKTGSLPPGHSARRLEARAAGLRWAQPRPLRATTATITPWAPRCPGVLLPLLQRGRPAHTAHGLRAHPPCASVFPVFSSPLLGWEGPSWASSPALPHLPDSRLARLAFPVLSSSSSTIHPSSPSLLFRPNIFLAHQL